MGGSEGGGVTGLAVGDSVGGGVAGLAVGGSVGGGAKLTESGLIATGDDDNECFIERNINTTGNSASDLSKKHITEDAYQK